MNINTILDIYNSISLSKETIKNSTILLRKQAFTDVAEHGFIKNAFDSRRIDQETEFNPRRGLQNYNRSEQFVTEAMSQKIKNLSKLKNVLLELQKEYGRQHEWQDSYARVLLSTLNKGLRADQEDGDFSENQPSVASLAYIEELLYVRYRLSFDDLTKLSENKLKKVILSKDEELIHKDMSDSLKITKGDIATQSYDTLMEKLFGGIKATKDNPEVERTVTITIKDKFNGNE